MPFMGFLLRRLKPGGQLILASNSVSYMEEAYRMFESTWEPAEMEMKIVQVDSTRTYRTHFERKYLERERDA